MKCKRLLVGLLVGMICLPFLSFGEDLSALRKKAEQGDAKAQFNLGIAYFDGQGVPEDKKEALKWFRLAAEQGNAKAQYNLGVVYFDGQGVPKDSKEAVKWYRLAADQGFAEAQFNLGWAYFFGYAVPQDYKEAVKWYRLAAEQGNAKAQLNLGVAYSNGQGVPQNQIEAVRWYRLAADQGSAEAQLNLGGAYFNGQGVPQNQIEAVKWWRLAADQGFAEAQFNLGVCYFKGLGVPQDDKEAVRWYRLSAKQGFAEAQKVLGGFYAPNPVATESPYFPKEPTPIPMPVEAPEAQLPEVDRFLNENMARVASSVTGTSARERELQAAGAAWALQNASKETNIRMGTEKRTATSWPGEFVGGAARFFVKTTDSTVGLVQKIVEANGGDSSGIIDLRLLNKRTCQKFNDTVLSSPEQDWKAPAIMGMIGEATPPLILLTGFIFLYRRYAAKFKKMKSCELSGDAPVWSAGMDRGAAARDMKLCEPSASESVAPPIPTNTIQNKEYGGIGRGVYFGWTFGLLVLQVLVPMLMWPLVIIGLIAGGLRFKNIGYNPWAILLGMIPIVNIVVAYRCLACPAGYAQTKQSDKAMRVISWIYGIFVLLLILAIAIPSILSAG